MRSCICSKSSQPASYLVAWCCAASHPPCNTETIFRCRLVTSPSKSEIDPSCQDCGAGSSANPALACNFKVLYHPCCIAALPSRFQVKHPPLPLQDLTVPASQPINFHYHSSTHNLFVGSSKCAYTTEICPSAPADTVTEASPCKYTPGSPGDSPYKTVTIVIFEWITY